MKKLITLTGIASIGVVLALISACETTSAGGGVASQQGQAGGQLGAKVPDQQLAHGPGGMGHLQQGSADTTNF